MTQRALAPAGFALAWLQGMGGVVLLAAVVAGGILSVPHIMPVRDMTPVTLAQLNVPTPAIETPEQILSDPTDAHTDIPVDPPQEGADAQDDFDAVGAIDAAPLPSQAAPTVQDAPPPAPPPVQIAEHVAGLHEPFGKDGRTIPMIGSDGLTPFDAYRRPVDPALAALPRVALVALPTLSDAARAALIDRLPPETAIVLSSAVDDNRPAAKDLRKKGFEVWQALTLEGPDFPLSDPGPRALYADASDAENRDALKDTLAINDGYVGVVPVPLDSALLGRARLLEMIAEELALRGLGLATPGRAARDLTFDRFITRYGHALQPALPLAQRQAELDRIIAAARRDNQAVVYFDPAPAVIDALARWTADFDAQGIALVPLSSLAAEPSADP